MKWGDLVPVVFLGVRLLGVRFEGVVGGGLASSGGLLTVRESALRGSSAGWDDFFSVLLVGKLGDFSSLAR